MLKTTIGTPDALFLVYGEHRLPVTNMFDMYGDETADPQYAVTVVALLPNNKWLTSECRPHDIQRLKLN